MLIYDCAFANLVLMGSAIDLNILNNDFKRYLIKYRFFNFILEVALVDYYGS